MVMTHDIKNSLKIFNVHAKIFENDLNKITKFAEKLEDIQYDMLNAEIIDHFNLDSKDVQGIDQFITSLVHMNSNHNDDLVNMLKESQLSDKVTENIKLFLKSLSEKSTVLLNLFYLADLQTRDKNTINEINHEMFIKLIHDDMGNIIGQTPIIKLQFFTGDDERINEYEIRINALKNLGTIFNQIADESIKSLEDLKKSSYTNRII